MSFHDADLIARALSLEDQNAFSELVRRHQSPVRAFLAKGRLDKVMARIPVRVSLNPATALAGAARCAMEML